MNARTFILFGALSSAACKSSSDPTPAPSASTLAPSSAVVTATTLTFVIDPASTTSIDLPGKEEHIVARTTAAKGRLTVDPHALSKSRGEVQIDLASLTTTTFPDAAKNEQQTTHARTWLEAVVNGRPEEANRWAVLAVRSLDVTGDDDLGQRPLEGAVRKVSAVVHGDVLVHGHKVVRAIPVGLEFGYAGAAGEGAPTTLHVVTEKPFTLVLKEHEIMPRDPASKVLQWTAELTHRVATDANVAVDLKATATP